MRILALSDIHGHAERLERILGSAGEVDLVLVAGDLTDFGGAAELDLVLAAMDGQAGKIVAVPGNCDKRAARERLEELGLSADGRLVERPGALVAGVGGSLLRTGFTPYERYDEELAEALQTALDEAALLHSDAPVIVLSHQPPRGTGADERRGASTGSHELRAILELEEPLLWVCGHIHESPCAFRVGSCLVLNPGPAGEGAWAIVELEREGGGPWYAEAELFG